MMTSATRGPTLDLARALSAYAGFGNGRSGDIALDDTPGARWLDDETDRGIVVADLARHGDLGVGTLVESEGEWLAVGGHLFHLRSDGSANPLSPGERTAFAAMTTFRPATRRTCTGPLDRRSLLEALDEMTASRRPFAAIRIDGHFRTMTTRMLTAAAMDPQTSDGRNYGKDVTGTIAGFRTPDGANGADAANYHLYFIDHDWQQGGQVLEFTLDEGTLEIDGECRFRLVLTR